MTTITFDTLKLARRLQEAGMDRELAEAQAEALTEAMDTGIEELATKADLRELHQDMRVFEERTQGRFTLLQWMVGFNIAITLATLWMLFKMVSA